MQMGNSIKLEKPEDTKSRLFHLDTPKAFKECMNVLYFLAKERKGIYVQILSKEKYKMAEVRAAYWCWIKEQYTSSQHDGTSEHDLHKRYKASYLLPTLCAKSEKFADMIIKADGDKEQIEMLLSIADGSLTGYKEMSAYFSQCKEKETYV